MIVETYTRAYLGNKFLYLKSRESKFVQLIEQYLPNWLYQPDKSTELPKQFIKWCMSYSVLYRRENLLDQPFACFRSNDGHIYRNKVKVSNFGKACVMYMVTH